MKKIRSSHFKHNKNKSNQNDCLLSIALRMKLSYLIGTTNLRDRYDYYHHFNDKKIEI